MKKIAAYLTTITLLSLHVNAGEFKLSPSYLSKQSTPKAKAILKDYEAFINIISQKPLHVKLEAVNQYLNGINPRYDDPTKANVDIWSTRGEFLSGAGGDCEDYTIAKYYTLKDLGIAPSKMCLLAVKEKYIGGDHMVLSVWLDDTKEPIVLDNLSFRILPLSKRTDLKADFCLNEEGSFTISKDGSKQKTTRPYRLKAYEKMLQRQSKEKIWQK